MGELSRKDYWDKVYVRGRSTTISLEGFRNYSNIHIYTTLARMGLDRLRCLEVGAGDSAWMPFLAARHPSSQFTGLDYSEAGCAWLKDRGARHDVKIETICADFLSPPKEMLASFDRVISFGVVEHFDDLAGTLMALRRFLTPSGKLYTLIPNMSGFVGRFTKLLNEPVFSIHNPHDLDSFLAGHVDAGLKIVEAKYLCSTDFGVLSSTVTKQTRWKYQVYLSLSRFSKVFWLIEHKGLNIRTSRLFSPYIYCIAQNE